jgi:signal transduction histidine kinase
LLAQMLGHFYEAKQREEAQRQNAYTHAIYETGARLTHDVKNLLQSMKMLCAAAANSSPEDATALQALIQRQLPQITQRLNTTLEKLGAPVTSESHGGEAETWWNALVQRYNDRNIEFTADGSFNGVVVPLELFDSVADNLLENALNKAAGQQALKVQVSFSSATGGTLSVCDDGAPVPASVAGQLFRGAVSSHTGLGVGLYQSSRLATQCGYRLRLESNAPGRVCFVLSPVAE